MRCRRAGAGWAPRAIHRQNPRRGRLFPGHTPFQRFSFSTLGAGDRLGVTETRKMSTDISVLTFKSGFLATWPGLSRDGSGWIRGPCSITVRTFHLTGPWFWSDSSKLCVDQGLLDSSPFGVKEMLFKMVPVHGPHVSQFFEVLSSIILVTSPECPALARI